ncbi:hypothetical protein [Variovorax sp. Varisp36]|uniref:hypothetical protein n=1 Tax=Variovorax sp. Varisp36 TaxID=3243031 RepID=UPI0039A57A35
MERKKESQPEWAEAVGAISLVCILASLALIAAGGWNWFAKFLETSAPAWVQAVGSVGAIIATGWGITRSHRLQQAQRKKDVEEDYIQLLAVAHLLVVQAKYAAAQTKAYEALSFGNKDVARRSTHADLKALLDAYRRFDVHRLLRYEYIQSFLAGEAATRRMIAVLEAQLDPNGFFHGRGEKGQSDQLVEGLQIHADRLGDAIRARKADQLISS